MRVQWFGLALLVLVLVASFGARADDGAANARLDPATAATASAYERQIAALEREQGAYGVELGESLWGLAQAQREAGRLGAAAQTLYRYLHVERALRGLHDLGQLRGLDALIEVQTDRADWKAVADAYALLEWLVHRNYGDDDPRQLPLLERLRAWHRGAYAHDEVGTLEQHYEAERALVRRGIRVMTLATGDARAATCHWLPECCKEPRAPNWVCASYRTP